MPIPVKIPLLNPNETEAVLVSVFVQDGQRVSKGDVICSLETTKSAADLEADQDGFILGLQHSAGQLVVAGEILCYLSEDVEWTPPGGSISSTGEQQATGGPSDLPPGLRITQPALAIARQVGLDLSTLPTDRLVTESFLRSSLERLNSLSGLTLPESQFDPTSIIVYGGGGHGKSVIEMLRLLGSYRILGVVDDGIPKGEQILGLPVLGDATELENLKAGGVRLAANAVGGIGDIRIRTHVFHVLAEAGFVCPALVHPRAFIEASASISPGVQVLPHAYVGSEAQLGFGCIVNTGAIVSHDCKVGDYANIAPGAVLAGEVQVGAGCLIGMGTTVNLQVKIGAGARIGNGSTVKDDVPEKGIVRAGAVWP